MLILTIRTDNPTAEIGLFEDHEQLAYDQWQAHRELAETIHQKIVSLMSAQGVRLHDLQAIVVFKGPGSFTGLRIGLSVANALAYSLGIGIVASDSQDWLMIGIERLLRNDTDAIALPEYGAAPNITSPKH